MAPVQLERETRIGPVVLVTGHFLVSVYLIIQASRSLRRAYQSLGPSQDTRGRVHRRNRLIPLFAILALVSLTRAVYGAVDYGVLSYKVWASSHGIEVPARFYGEKGIIPHGENAIHVHILPWLSDTPVHLDALEIVAEKTRRLWWGQQLYLGLISWSMFLAIEGRRRNIPQLWCYQLLGQLVSLSFAQNLFFLAMLLTPVPIPANKSSSSNSWLTRLRNGLLPRKPANWTPHVSVFPIILAFNFAIVPVLHSQANKANFQHMVLASRALTLAPLTVQYVLPASWGSRYRDIGDVYGTFRKLFQAVSVASFGLHVWTSVVALAHNAPDSHHHRHSAYLMLDVERRSAWERTTSAFGKILEAAGDHPVVGAAGADVILTALSFGLWVATRAMNVSDILACTIPGVPNRKQVDDESIATAPSKERGNAQAFMSGANGMGNTGGGVGDEPGQRRRRGQKISKREPDDSSYKPAPAEEIAAEAEEGDVLLTDDLDWESAAVVWGLTALGGLGVGSSGAYGSEIIAV
ncbi:hypothetical protein BGZ63DRAFT_374695 [Mariannaea sp. PMI_226]|nr:hypothetical protein BGZ63DRAFT_374695 [Mariannaea sp. PMI_226]